MMEWWRSGDRRIRMWTKTHLFEATVCWEDRPRGTATNVTLPTFACFDCFLFNMKAMKGANFRCPGAFNHSVHHPYTAACPMWQSAICNWVEAWKPREAVGEPVWTVVSLQVAREALCELELPHLYRSVARGSPKRQILFEARGQFQVPYLEVLPQP